MLTSHSPVWQHASMDIFLLVLSCAFVPISITYFLTLGLTRYIMSSAYLHRARRSAQEQPEFVQRTILVTGVGMTKGLFLARTFYAQGHHVIGADFEPYYIPVCGRFSACLRRFYRLVLPGSDVVTGTAAYIDGLLTMIRREQVDMWISCSGVASAVSDGQAREVIERRSDCVCIQFDAATTATLHEKDTFIAATKALGLPTPDTHNVSSQEQILHILDQEQQKSYILKSVGVDDISRGEIMTLLPRPSKKETHEYISHVDFSPSKKWILQEFVEGQEFCTHAFVLKGQVQSFLACPSSDMVMHYTVLPPASPLSRAMLDFTEQFASKFGDLNPDSLSVDGIKTFSKSKFTGHLSFDFLVDESDNSIKPIECNPRVHTAVALFAGKEQDTAAAYLQALSDQDPPLKEPLMPSPASTIYWIGHDAVTLIFQPLFLLHNISSSFARLMNHVLSWQDGTYVPWDPLPVFWLYHVYWPLRFCSILWELVLNVCRCSAGSPRGRWNQINVSTGKVFEC